MDKPIDWVKIFSTQEVYLAEIAKSVLEEADIAVVILNKQDSAYLVFGEAEVYVSKDDALKASNLIKELKE